MSKIMEFFGTLCVSSVAMGALCILLPQSSFKKPVKYTLCICFLCIVLSGFSVGIFKNEATFTSNSAEISTENALKKAAERNISSALDNAGIDFSDLTLLMSKDGSGGINIIEVTLRSPEEPEKIIEVIGNENYEVTVINE